MQSREMALFLVDLFDDLHNVFVAKNVVLADTLRLMLGRRAPNDGALELLDDGLVDGLAEILHRVQAGLEHHWRTKCNEIFNSGIVVFPPVVWQLTLGFRVDAHQVELLPHLTVSHTDGTSLPYHGQELIEIPLVMRRDWYAVGNL